MPGLVVYKRRWLVGSDDLILPASFLITFQIFCIVLISIALSIKLDDTTQKNAIILLYYEICSLVVLSISVITEFGICAVSLRGTILDTQARAHIKYYLYAKTVLLFFDIALSSLGVYWLYNYHHTFPNSTVKELILASVSCGWVLFVITFLMIEVSYDRYGKHWVNGNWLHERYQTKYHRSIEKRCRFWFSSCVNSSKRNEITGIAKIISDFFFELDVVASDIVAGFILLKHFQKLERKEVLKHSAENGIQRFLSGVPVRETTALVTSNDSDVLKRAAHYMHFANAAYGWPVYVIGHNCGLFKMMPRICCCCRRPQEPTEIFNDNLCGCNFAALQMTLKLMDVDVIYITYHCDINETPFFVAVDYNYNKIVISVRGTLSMQDILTDLNGENEVLPLKETREDWLCHRGMLQAALYIKDKLAELKLIERALDRDPARETETFDLVVVGHSLGAGTASILGILLKEVYPSLECYCFSAPGGTLSLPVVEYTKTFITTVVLGEDFVPRLGLRQLENLRTDLTHVLKETREPKWKTLSRSFMRCCCCSSCRRKMPTHNIDDYKEQKTKARCAFEHTLDNARVLALHHPLYPPGRIIHIGRRDPDDGCFEAIWSDTKDYDEVLISQRMMKDHVPDAVLSALKQVAEAYQ